MTVRRIVLLGAARSGTKIVRDVLAEATGGGSVPYDVGFIWRYGNERSSHDALDPGSVTPRVQRFISHHIDRYAGGQPPIVFEKTVGNTLRVPFVHRVMPDAAFVHLIRDGVDVAESTRRQWTAQPDFRYLVDKVRHFPPRLLPTYGRKYAASLARRRLTSAAHVDTWGPRYPGIDSDVQSEPLLTVCARQWRWSVESALDALSELDAPQIELRYERLVENPVDELTRVLAALDLPVELDQTRRAGLALHACRSGAGPLGLSHDELALCRAEIAPTLRRLGYAAPSTEET